MFVRLLIYFLMEWMYVVDVTVAEGIGDKYTYRYGPTAAVIDDAESSAKCPDNFFGTTCQCAVNQNCDGSYFTNDTCRAFTKGEATSGVQAKITCVPKEPYVSYFNVLKKLWYSDPNPETDKSHRLSIECPIGSTMTGCSLYSFWMPSFSNGTQDCAIKSGLCTSSVYCPSHRCSIQARCRKVSSNSTLEDEYNGYYYKFFDVPKNWSQAQSVCREEHLNLAIPSDADESKWLSVSGRCLNNGIFWIGLQKNTDVGNFLGPDGSPVLFLAWRTGEYRENLADDGNCVGMYPNGKWGAFNCSRELFFVCKRPEYNKWIKHYAAQYKFVNSAKMWNESQGACELENTSLMTPESASEQSWLAFLVKDFRSTFWIGIHDLSVEGHFMRPDGSKIRYTSWDKNEPNQAGGEEGCVNINLNGNWNDLSCENALRFVCTRPGNCSVMDLLGDYSAQGGVTIVSLSEVECVQKCKDEITCVIANYNYQKNDSNCVHHFTDVLVSETIGVRHYRKVRVPCSPMPTFPTACTTPQEPDKSPITASQNPEESSETSAFPTAWITTKEPEKSKIIASQNPHEPSETSALKLETIAFISAILVLFILLVISILAIFYLRRKYRAQLVSYRATAAIDDPNVQLSDLPCESTQRHSVSIYEVPDTVTHFENNYEDLVRPSF